MLRGICRPARFFKRLPQLRKFHVEAIDKEGITISGLDITNEPVKFRNLFLRDACGSAESVDASTKQKTFSTGQLDPSVAATTAVVNSETNSLDVEWNDGNKSNYSQEFLETYSNKHSRRKYRKLDHHDMHIWNHDKTADGAFSFNDAFKVPYSSYMGNQNDLVKHLHKDGIAFVTHIPPGEKLPSSKVTVEAIAEKIGPIKQTFYGPSWNVVSEFNAKNVAYTAVYLPLHMDLLYFESPPGVQLLHVIENNTMGGESLFADSFAAALHILEHDRLAYAALTKVPITYHYVNDDKHYYHSRPLIVEDANSPIDNETGRKVISHVNYSPPFQGPFDAFATDKDLPSAIIDNFHRGLQMFEQFIEEPKNQIEVKMEEDTCVLFMNRRILHGRRQFQPGSGNRWFKGTYLDIDAFQSKYRMVSSS